ncbi:MAG: septum formation initiator family protein [Bacteroidales bacterium]|nr:septum formation initiator family protein [Bacteroidales bacterium]
MRHRIPSILRNRYFLAFLLVLVWLVFFDTHNFINQWRMRRQMKELQHERDFYRDEIYRDSLAIEELKNNPDALERYAREKYLMKRDNEDVFIIVEE